MFAHEFMRNALIAGSFVGLGCGLAGYFVVLRAQVFAGDALSHVAFTGALAAAVFGLDIRAGLFAATIFGGIALSVAIALAVTWLGLALAYFSIYPVGFYITSLSFALYVVVRLAGVTAFVPEPA